MALCVWAMGWGSVRVGHGLGLCARMRVHATPLGLLLIELCSHQQLAHLSAHPCTHSTRDGLPACCSLWPCGRTPHVMACMWQDQGRACVRPLVWGQDSCTCPQQGWCVCVCVCVLNAGQNVGAPQHTWGWALLATYFLTMKHRC